MAIKAHKAKLLEDLSVLASLTKGDRDKLARGLIKQLETYLDKAPVKAGGKDSTSWKMLERLAAFHMKGRRISRGSDFSVKDVDVIVDFRALRVDGKYRRKHAHHTFMQEIGRKYCVYEGDVPVLVTKHPGMKGAFVTVPLEHYGHLLDVARFALAAKLVHPPEEVEKFLSSLRFKPFKKKDPDDDR